MKYFVTLLPAVSTTVIELFRVAVAGTVKVTPAGNAPPAVVVVTTAAELYTTAPLSVTLKLTDTPKPAPVTVTGVPLSPVVTDKPISDITVNVVVAVLAPSLTSRVYVPAGIAGTINHVVRLYAFVPVVGDAVAPKVVPGVTNRFDSAPPRVAVVIVVSPTTVRVIFAPTFPDAAAEVTDAALSIVKVAFACSVGNVRVREIVYVPAATLGTVKV